MSDLHCIDRKNETAVETSLWINFVTLSGIWRTLANDLMNKIIKASTSQSWINKCLSSHRLITNSRCCFTGQGEGERWRRRAPLDESLWTWTLIKKCSSHAVVGEKRKIAFNWKKHKHYLSVSGYNRNGEMARRKSGRHESERGNVLHERREGGELKSIDNSFQHVNDIHRRRRLTTIF